MLGDLWRFVVAVFKQTTFVLTGTVIAVVLVLWPHVAPLIGPKVPREIPDRPFWGLVALSFFWATFLAWREEHAKVTADTDGELRDLASSMVETYVTLAQKHSDEGPHALATLNLPALGSDALIRKTIHRMDQQVGRDPWEGWARFVEDIDLVKFFAWVREHGVSLHVSATNVEEVAKQVIAAGGQRTERQRAMDLRITDNARQLRRQLTATFEEWNGRDPTKIEDLTLWAVRFATGYRATEPAIRKLVDLRAEASHYVQEAVGKARDHFDAAADLVNPLMKSGLTVNDANRAEVERKLREAVTHVREALKALSL